MAVFSLGLAHLLIVIGVLIYFFSPLGVANFSSSALKSDISRLYVLEHPLVMIVGVVIMTIGYRKTKTLEADKKKYRTLLLSYSVGLILILSRIPWWLT